MATTLGPGQRIEAHCTRCQDRTGHVIVAMVGEAIVKVECCACKSVHKYYPPRLPKGQGKAERVTRAVRTGASRKDAMAAPQSSTSSPKRLTSKALAEANAVEKAWRQEMERPSAPEARPYAMGMLLQAQDVIKHAHFGLGVVVETVAPDKAKILFRDGTRVLRCTLA